jgi:mono/diheme cytochrome c family protein
MTKTHACSAARGPKAGRAGGIAVLAGLLAWAAAAPARAQEVGYDQLAPILQARCVMCHSGPAAPLGLQLDSLAGLLKGSSKGPVARAGEPAGSELIKRLKGSSQPRMPMTGPPYLSDAEVALFERWIAGGMKPGAASATATAASAPATRPRPGPNDTVTYADVAPVFAQRCAKCHTRQGGIMGPPPEGVVLTSYEDTLSSADRARVVSGHPGASELVRRVRGQSRPRMPFDGPPYLDEADIVLIERWVAQGARNAAGQPAPLPVGARVRLQGTLQADGRLDGQPLDLGGARIRKGPRPGDFVEVRGNLRADGTIDVERLRTR